MPTTETFSITKVNRLRRRAERAREIDPGDRGGGWQKSPVDPMDLLRVFKPLRMRPGYTLCAFVIGQGNGEGVVWAVPEDAAMPEVDAEAGLFDPPRPPDAIEDFRGAIVGDGSPWSYLCASLFAREAAEFGAEWSGCWWSDWTIIGMEPAAMTKRARSTLGIRDIGRFAWEEPKPEVWEPSVTVRDDGVVVTFHGYTGLEHARISRWEDRYECHSYAFTTREIVVASAGVGYIP